MSALTELRALLRSLYELGYCSRSLWEAAIVSEGKIPSAPVPGLEPELFKRVMRVAARDVEAIRRRLEAGEALLARFRDSDQALSQDDRHIGEMLSNLADTGSAPRGGRNRDGERFWTAVPEMLFLTRADLTPILILLAGRTGRNLETLKELSATHIVREGLVLETRTIKRRRKLESEPVAWDIGRRHQQLKYPGGLYLLIHSLTRRSRELASSDALLCVWSQADGGKNSYPWSESLSNQGLPDVSAWCEAHRLVENGQPLRLTFSRIKTTVDRNRAMKTDFDLDRAAVTNTPAVLYRSYVNPDPTARRALREITANVLEDLDRQLTVAGSPEKVLPISSRDPIDVPDPVSTAFMQCRNLLGHPGDEGVECTATILDCFACPCAVVSDENIPTIIRLSEEIAERFERLPFDAWVGRYGQTWLAINNDILPSRTPQELASFAANKPAATALQFLEDPEMF